MPETPGAIASKSFRVNEKVTDDRLGRLGVAGVISTPNRVLRYGQAVAAVAVALALRLALDQVLGDRAPFISFPLAILVAARYGGLGPGIFATGLSILSAWFFCMEPRGSFAITQFYEVVDLALLGGMGAAITLLSDRLRRTLISSADTAERYSLLVNGVAEYAIFVIGLDRSIASWNPGAERLFGYTTPEARGRPVSMLSIPEDREDGRAESVVSDTGAPKVVRWNGWRVRKDGSRFWAEVTVTALRDHAGTLRGFSNLTRDMTAEHAHQAQLEESEETTRALLESAAQGVLGVNDEGEILIMNAMAEHLFGYARAELMGQNLELLLPERLRERHRGHRVEFQADPRMRPMGLGLDLLARRKDGSEFPVEISLSSVHTRNGRLSVSLITDITERRNAQQALRESQATLEIALEAAELGTWDYDIASGEVKASRRMLSIYGLSSGCKRSEFLGAMHPEDRKHVDQASRDAAERVGGYETEFRVVKPGGAIRWVMTKAISLAGADGRAARTIGVAQDITERKDAERRILDLNLSLEQRVQDRTAQLEAANKELEAFSYSVSHDLRAPLRGIDGWSLALLEDYGQQLDRQAHEYLERVRSETQRMGMLIDDLLQLSRISRIDMDSQPVDLSEMAARIVARLQEGHQERNIQFTVDPGMRVCGDARLLEVALTNLLANAAKFTGARADAQIACGRANESVESIFYVRDNGVGFDMTYADKLFGAFQRFHKASEFPGTGVGLATVQRVIHRHGGRVWAESQPGQGATFYFTVGRRL